MLSLDLLGMSSCNYLGRDTISAHPWHRAAEWQISISNSLWTLKPKENTIYLLTECYLQISADIVLDPSNAMIIEAYFYDGSPSVEIVKFKNFDELLLRSTEVTYYDVNLEVGASLSKPFYKAIIPFASEVILWHSAFDKEEMSLYPNSVPKFSHMTCRIANNQPYKNKDSQIIDTCWSRYFVHMYGEVS